MEIMYAIISILFLSAVLLLMVMLFGKRKVSFFNFSKKKNDDYPADEDPNRDYYLKYNGSAGINQTIKVGTVEVTVTNVRDKSVHVTTTIDPSMNKGGVSIGRGKNCDYNMSSMLIDSDGAFLVKQIGDTYVLLANLDSLNGMTKTYGGERCKSIYFTPEGTATCFVGPIRFDFRLPGAEPQRSADSFTERKPNFYEGTIGVTKVHSI